MRVGVDAEELTFEGIESVTDMLSAPLCVCGFPRPDFASDAEELEIRAVGTGETVIDVHSVGSNFDGDLRIDGINTTSLVMAQDQHGLRA